jgi:hypothetical protein
VNLVDSAPHDRVRIEPPGVIPVPLEHGVVDPSRLRLGRTRATASTSSLFGLPNAALLAIVTLGVLLIRFVFHDPSSAIYICPLPAVLRSVVGKLATFDQLAYTRHT